MKRKLVILSLVSGLCIVVLIFSMFLIIREKELPLQLEDIKHKVETEIKRDPRFGVSAILAEGYDLESLGIGWYFNWTFKPAAGVELEFMPLIAGYVGNDNVSEEYLAELEQYIRSHSKEYPDGTIWMVGNEIGYIPQKDTRSPEQYAEDYNRCYEMLKKINSSYKLAVGPIILSQNEKYVIRKYVEGKGGIHYLKRVLESYREKFGEEMPVDFYTATSHVLENQGRDIGTFKEQIIGFRRFLASRGQTDKGLIITEFGCAIKGPSAAEVVSFMKEAVNFLATAGDEKIGCTEDESRLVQRWAWFTLHSISPMQKLRLLGLSAFFINISQTSLLNRDGKLNCLGKTYRECIRSIGTKSEGPHFAKEDKMGTPEGVIKEGIN